MLELYYDPDTARATVTIKCCGHKYEATQDTLSHACRTVGQDIAQDLGVQLWNEIENLKYQIQSSSVFPKLLDRAIEHCAELRSRGFSVSFVFRDEQDELDECGEKTIKDILKDNQYKIHAIKALKYDGPDKLCTTFFLDGSFYVEITCDKKKIVSTRTESVLMLAEDISTCIKDYILDNAQMLVI